MFLRFFYTLRQQGIPVSLHEYLTLLRAVKVLEHSLSLDEFYALAKTILVQKEVQLDRFDLVFGYCFGDLTALPDELMEAVIPPDWLRAQLESMNTNLPPGEQLDYDKLLERFRELLAEQREAHHGGNKWIGTGGTSPFGNGGTHEGGMRIGGEGGKGSAARRWQSRDFRNLDDRVELNTRNIKVILKRLRQWSREGVATELDIDGTIQQTSENAGLLDVALRPDKQNRIKVLLLMDVGGSMDAYVELCEQLFSAAKWSFKQLKFFYFHNCVYDRLWEDNQRRHLQAIPTLEVLNKYGKDYRLIFVGDAAMSPYELYYRGGSAEHFNDEAGLAWLDRLKTQFPHMVWINPTPEYEWDWTDTTRRIRQWSGGRMFPMTYDGLTAAMTCLRTPGKTWKNEVWEDESEDR